jgi:hypothetical protein
MRAPKSQAIENREVNLVKLSDGAAIAKDVKNEG